MDTLNILITQLGMFVIYILAGILLIRTKVLNRENMEVVSRLVIKLALPVMIFTSTVNGVDKEMLPVGETVSSAGRPSAAVFCHERIWKYRIYGDSYCNQYLPGKRNALYFCIYYDRSADVVDCWGKTYFKSRT